MTAVHVRILHLDASAGAGPLTAMVAAARRDIADHHAAAFASAGAGSVQVIAGQPDDVPFGARLERLVADLEPPDGLVILGSGAVPLLTVADRRRFLAAAGSGERIALANNRYSADIVAIGRARDGLRDLPTDLATDNALPRWLAEHAAYDVDDVRGRWRLGVDIDSPLDLVLLGGRFARSVPAPQRDRVDGRLAAVRNVVADPRAEVIVSGRTSPATLIDLERRGAARTRALIEERGLRTSVSGQRPPASVLGALLERDGPKALGAHLARLGEAAVIDSRVLLAHRLGADERAWPSTEDRFASDLLLHGWIADPWLAALTASALEAPIPVLLGGHTLVGPGLRLALGERR